MADLTFFFVSSVIFTKGNLTSSLHKFNKLAAYLTGLGLLSINKELCNGINISLISFALDNKLLLFLLIDASLNSEQSIGATLAVTEIHQSPPLKLNSKAVPSSPDN